MDNPADRHSYDGGSAGDPDQQNAGHAVGLRDGRRFGAEANLTTLEAEQATSPAGTDQQNAGQVVLRKIELCRELFQPRAEDEAHTKDLSDALKRRGELEPLLVLRVGKRVILIDGHHRYTAYWRGGWRDKAVPVTWFEGSVAEAAAESRKANSRAKLPMTTPEKQNAAWLMVRLGRYTRPQIMEAAGVSDGQIGTMRRVLKKYGAAVIETDSWFKARQFSDKQSDWEPPTDDEREAELLAKAKRYAERMRKTFHSVLARNPDLFAMVLREYCNRNLKRVHEAVGDIVQAEPWDAPDPSDENDF
jgi:ParB-like chromosome segregation protein Spo0J